MLAVALLWRRSDRSGAHGGRGSLVTLAVLPFQNLGTDSQSDFLGLAIPDEVVNGLGYAPSLAVRPFAATRKYSGSDVDLQAVGRELRVSDIITGHFAREGERLRITLEAVEVESNRLLWRDSISVPAGDVLSMQERITARVRQGLLPALGATSNSADPGSRPRNAEAYDLFLRSAAVPNDPGPNREAIRMVEHSVGLDPNYAPAWATLSVRYYRDYIYGSGGEQAYQKSKAAVERALALDPQQVIALRRFIVLLTEEGQLEAAYDKARDFLRQRRDSPHAHFSMAYVLRYAGLLEDSARECDEALSLDPHNPAHRSCAIAFMQLGRYERATEYARLDGGSQWASDMIAAIEVRRKNLQEALQRYRQLRSANEATTLSSLMVPCLEKEPSEKIAVGARQQEQSLREVRDPEPNYHVAAAASYCGQHELALRLLRRAVGKNYCSYPAIESDPLFASLRSHPEFHRIRDAGVECQKKFASYRSSRG